MMKAIIQWLQIFSPKLVARMAYKFMSNPRVKKLRESEEIVLRESTMEKVKFKDGLVQKYQWGDPDQKVALLIHGWEGQAGNFAAIIHLLLKKNYQVVAYDAPSHGKSSKVNTNMFEFAKFIRGQYSDLKPSLVISHSFGSVNSARVFRNNPEFNLKMWIMATTPHNFLTRVKDISGHFGMNTKATTELINLIQKDTTEDINRLNMATYCGELTNVKKAVIAHSKSDKVLPIEGARFVAKAFDNSSLIELDNLGHYSLLWSEEFKQIVSDNS